MTSSEISQIKEWAQENIVPKYPSTRDHQPLSLNKMLHPTPQPRIISIPRNKDPLKLQEKRHPENDGLPQTKEALQKAIKQVDDVLEKQRVRRDKLKRKLHAIEVKENEELKTALCKEKKMNATLQERLLAARDLRREADQKARQIQGQAYGQPVGTTILRY